MKYLLPLLFLLGCASGKTYDQGVVRGCTDAYRDLYTKLGINNIDEKSLTDYCAFRDQEGK